MPGKKHDLDVAKRRASYRIYAIELRPEILECDPKFREANPSYRAGLECLYVGMTGLSRRARWKNQRRGHKASRRAKKYGVRLRRDLSGSYGLLDFEAAKIAEEEWAEKLRSQGYAVWQH